MCRSLKIFVICITNLLEFEKETTTMNRLNNIGAVIDTSKRSGVSVGQIKSIYVENFMCHRKFTLKLGKHLNFITGRNGSGKTK